MFTQLSGQRSGHKWTKVTYAACVFCSHYSKMLQLFYISPQLTITKIQLNKLMSVWESNLHSLFTKCQHEMQWTI